jgi:hypothetical protein
MSDANGAVHARTPQLPPHGPRTHATSWRREVAELSALFVAVGLAHLLATLLGHREPGPIVLIGLGLALIGGTAVHKRLASRYDDPPPRRARFGMFRNMPVEPPRAVNAEAHRTMRLWRIRTRVVERPGRLAELAGAFARLRCDILALHIATTGASVISRSGCDALDEFLVEAPAELTARALRSAVDDAGGLDIVIVPAQIQDLVDPGVQALLLAHRVGDDPDQLPSAMSELLRTTQIEWRRPGETTDDTAEPNTTMVVSVHPEGALMLKRPHLPFTPTEAARAAALAAAARHRRYAGGP